MRLIYNKIFLDHDTGMHPESQKRLMALGDLKEVPVINGEEYLGLVHRADYIKTVQEASRTNQRMDQDTITSTGSYAAAVHAVGAAIMASETQDFAAIRPPGHHAYPSRASGFCLFNNIAIAVQKLVNEGKRVMILDFDGHLGDGTYHIFKETNKVLFWSLHQYPGYPGGGSEDDIGTGAGRGFSVNVPLPPHSGDDVFKNAIERFMPVARQFAPDVVAVSAGFDAHQSDPLLDLRLSVNMYYDIGKLLAKEFTNVFAVLEGGYELEYMPKCLYNFVDGFNGAPQRNKEHHTDTDIMALQEYEFRADHLERNLSAFWKF
ncbi:MAG: histone deacetylase [Cyclobacteriaceae bacterium]|nr:histone deacetylase [Cyclobacteriaceae bacterium]